MHPMARNFVSASRSAWTQRRRIVGLQLVIWIPIYALVAVLPTKRSELGKLFFESLGDPLWIAALLHLCRAERRGRPISVFRALRRGAKSYARLFGIRIVLEFRIFAGVLALVVPGIILFGRYALMDVLAICEPLGPTQCRKRSSDLAHPHLVGLLGLIAAGTVAQWGVSELVDWVTAAIGSALVTAACNVASVSLSVFLPMTLFEYYRSQLDSVAASAKPV